MNNLASGCGGIPDLLVHIRKLTESWCDWGMSELPEMWLNCLNSAHNNRYVLMPSPVLES